MIDILALLADLASLLHCYPQRIELCARHRSRRKAGGDWLAVWQAAEQLGGVSEKLVYRLYHGGELDGVKIAGTVRIRAASVVAYLNAHSNRVGPSAVPTDPAPAIIPKAARRREKPGFRFVRLPPP